MPLRHPAVESVKTFTLIATIVNCIMVVGYLAALPFTCGISFIGVAIYGGMAIWEIVHLNGVAAMTDDEVESRTRPMAICEIIVGLLCWPTLAMGVMNIVSVGKIRQP